MKHCDICQIFGNIIHTPTMTLHSMSSPWPFYKGGIDIVGLLPQATGQRKFILVATDYFTKWAKVEAYAQIKATQLKQFVQKNIVCRFGVPYSIVSDNGPQFISKPFQQFCTEFGIKKCLLYTPVSPIQWASQSHKKNISQVFEETVDSGKGKVGK